MQKFRVVMIVSNGKICKSESKKARSCFPTLHSTMQKGRKILKIDCCILRNGGGSNGVGGGVSFANFFANIKLVFVFDLESS